MGYEITLKTGFLWRYDTRIISTTETRLQRSLLFAVSSDRSFANCK